MDSVFRYFKDIKERKIKYNFKLSLAIMIPALLGTIIPWFYYDVFHQEESELAAQLLTWFLLPGMLVSVFILQRYKLLGRYGDAVILLIPTFIWLLPEYEEVMDVLLYIGLGVSGFMILDFVMALYFINKKNYKNDKDKDKGPLYAMVSAKLQFTLAAFLITISSSITLIDWGDFGMHWLRNNDVPDVSKESWVMFIAMVAMLVVLFMIAESMFESILIVKYKGYEADTTEISLSTIKRFKHLKSIFKKGPTLEKEDITLVKNIIKDEVKKRDEGEKRQSEEIKELTKDLKKISKENEKQNKEIDKLKEEKNKDNK